MNQRDHSENTQTPPPVSTDLYSPRANDPDNDLFDTTRISATDNEQIGRLMNAMGQLRTVERSLAQASENYMKLGQNDMRALQFVIAQSNQGIDVSPSALATHLGITTASTTKLLDRLERRGHISRHPNPSDRRGLTVTVTPETRAAALSTVGRIQVARIPPVLALTSAERETVISFLTETAESLRKAIDATLPKTNDEE